MCSCFSLVGFSIIYCGKWTYKLGKKSVKMTYKVIKCMARNITRSIVKASDSSKKRICTLEQLKYTNLEKARIILNYNTTNLITVKCNSGSSVMLIIWILIYQITFDNSHYKKFQHSKTDNSLIAKRQQSKITYDNLGNKITNSTERFCL